MPGLDSLLDAVPVVVGCFFLHRDCFCFLAQAWILLVRLVGTRGRD